MNCVYFILFIFDLNNNHFFWIFCCKSGQFENWNKSIEWKKLYFFNYFFYFKLNQSNNLYKYIFKLIFLKLLKIRPLFTVKLKNLSLFDLFQDEKKKKRKDFPFLIAKNKEINESPFSR